jgi:tyrosine-specific transport protein
MNRKIIGSILMLLGTCIGAGMIAIPVASAHENFTMNILLLVAAWFIMTVGAFAILEVNLWHKPGSNLITMAQSTLGGWGKIVTWLLYLLLMYSLICAYLSGASDIVQALLSYIHIDISRWLATVIALVILGSIVIRGIKTVDMTNRSLMSIKLLAYLVVVIAIMPYVHSHLLTQGDLIFHNSAFLVMFTSFGYATSIPTVREYLNTSRRTITWVVLAGSTLPLIVFSLWLFVIQGLIPRSGADGLVAIAQSGNTNSMLMTSVSQLVHSVWLGYAAKLFISICAITSFLGISIGLTDFIADGIKKTKQGWNSVLVHAISFLPPLAIVLLAPHIFIEALTYAGIWCVILLIVMPLLMLYSGRHHKALSDHHILPGGRGLLLFLLVIAMLLLVIQFID